MSNREVKVCGVDVYLTPQGVEMETTAVDVDALRKVLESDKEFEFTDDICSAVKSIQDNVRVLAMSAEKEFGVQLELPFEEDG